MDLLLWGVLPYLVALVLVAGLIWRYRYDQFGWTTRSSQLYESRLLRIASPLFHFGLAVVLAGHLMGLLIPKAWTDLVVTPGDLPRVALVAGTLAGIATLVGHRPADLPPAHHRSGVPGHDAQRQADVRGAGGRDRARPGRHPHRRQHPDRRGTQLPRDGLDLVPFAAGLLQPDVAGDGGQHLAVQGAHPGRARRCSRWCRSAGWCTPSPSRCTTCSGPTSSTAAATSSRRRPPADASAAGTRSAPRTTTRGSK